MDTPSTKSPISLDDFGGDEEPTSAPQTPPTPLDKIVEDVEDGWEDALVLPEVEIAPDPIVFPEEEDVSTFLCRQPLENGVTRYVVQRGFTVEEKVYKPGDIIPVQCRFCVLWNREWLGKTRCHPGRILSNSTIMSADKFSCERYFVCKEMEPEFKTFLAFSHPTVLMIAKLLPATKQVLERERLARRFLYRYKDVDPVEVFKVAREFLSVFTSLPQLALMENFVAEYDTIQAERAAKIMKKRGRPPLPHGPGDLVAWLEPELNSVIKGVVVRRSRGRLVISCIDGPEHLLGQKMKYDYNEWRTQKRPTLLRKAVDRIVKANT